MYLLVYLYFDRTVHIEILALLKGSHSEIKRYNIKRKTAKYNLCGLFIKWTVSVGFWQRTECEMTKDKLYGRTKDANIWKWQMNECIHNVHYTYVCAWLLSNQVNMYALLFWHDCVYYVWMNAWFNPIAQPT